MSARLLCGWKHDVAKREAILWTADEQGIVTCAVCPRRCVIQPKKSGYCKARVNEDGRLFTLIYGMCSSLAADPIEKKPVYHFRPGTLVFSVGTVGCNLRCKHCQNWQISRASADELGRELADIPPETLVALARREGCDGLAWTYNEPTIWLEYVLDGAMLAAREGLYTVMVTNGYITFEALDELGGYIDVWRVDVKGFTDETYRKLAAVPHMAPILQAAERAKHKWKMHVEVVTNVIPSINDSDEELGGIARWMVERLGADTPWHVTRFVPYLELSHLPPTPVETLERAVGIGRKAGLKYVYVGNVPGHNDESTRCPACNEVVIARQGYRIQRRGLDRGHCVACGEPLPLVE